MIGTTMKYHRQNTSPQHAEIKFNKGIREKLNDGVSKISTDKLLIYIKTIPEFFTGEHTPLMCWKGSGYKFSSIATTSIQGITIYKGTLVKEGKSLYTAWWYSNGHVETISQLDWRMRMLRGEPGFYLINVTAEDQQTLINSLRLMFSNGEFAVKVHI
jgi:exosortase N